MGYKEIVFENVKKIYKSLLGKPKIIALNNLNLEINSGEIVCLLGANGAGKTTAIKILCGLTLPTSGSVFIHDTPVNLYRRKYLSALGVVLEGSRGLYWRLNPIENFQYFGGIWGIPRGKEFHNRINNLLNMLDLYKDRTRPICEFSRGMKQKAAIALALLSNPHVLLLDEPTLGLDIVTTNTIIDFLHQTSKTLGKTIIVTTHDLKLAQAISDRVAILKEGNLVAYDSINNLSKMWETNWYEITVTGEILNEELDNLNPILISKDFCKEKKETILIFEITNNKDIYLIIEKLKHLNCNFISAKIVEPDLEKVYINFYSK